MQKLLDSLFYDSLLATTMTSTVEQPTTITVDSILKTMKEFEKPSPEEHLYRGMAGLGMNIYLMQPPTKKVPKKIHIGVGSYHRRIQKKWNKRYGFVTVLDESVDQNTIYRTPNGLHVYPKVYTELKNVVNEGKDKYLNRLW